MNTPTDLEIWLQQQAWPLIIIAILVALTYAALRISSERRRKALTEERSGESETTFVYALGQHGLDPVISAATYRYLQEVQRVHFPILPTDFLDEDLGLGHEDIEQSIRELAIALRRDLNPGQERTAVLSVEDLVRLLQACPPAAKTIAA